MRRIDTRAAVLHILVIAGLYILQSVLPPFHHSMMTRILVFSIYALGYNILLGYLGLMSLGHAMLFSTGLYAVGLTVLYLGFNPLTALFTALAASIFISAMLGVITLRTSGVFFLIVTLIFSQVFYLTTIYFNNITYGDQGFVISRYLKPISLGPTQIDLADSSTKYNLALLFFGFSLLANLYVSRSRLGLVLAAVKDNPEKAEALGYNVFHYKLLAFVLSGTISGLAGAAYALIFSYIGSSLAFILNSINPLLWTILGGAGTTLGPLTGTLLMIYIVDFTSSFTESYLLVVGLALILTITVSPHGIVGSVRRRWLRWLP
jgi:branched-chain amino acid transport system permease protein